MDPEPESTNPADQALDAADEENKYTGTFVIFLSIVGIAFIIAQDYRNPQSNWANHLGSGLACGVLSLGTAGIILLFVLGFPKNRNTWRIFFSKIAIPMIFTGLFWLWRTDAISAQEAERGEYAKLAHEKIREQKEKIREQDIKKQEADPVIRRAKMILDDRIRESISKTEGAIKIDGWSTSPLDGGTWLVKFEYNLNGIDKWFLYEYNDYIHDFKSVFSNEIIKNQYLDSDSDGASINQATRRRMGDWYGPIR